MFTAKLYDHKTGFFKVTEFKSLALLLARSKADEKYRIKVKNGSEEFVCVYNPRQGWIIGKRL